MRKYWVTVISFLKRNLPLILVFLFQIPLIFPFFHKGFFPSHDDVQVTRIFEMFQSLSFGDIPPRWSANLLFGRGYPLYIFYGPLPYLIGAMFVKLEGNFLLATKTVFVLSFFLGPLGIYLLSKKWWGKLPALVAAAAFSLSPYRAVDVFVRGNLGEYFSFSLFPLVLYFNWMYLSSSVSEKKKWGLIFCLFLFFAEISHNVSCFIFFFFLLLFNLFYFFIFQKEKKISQIISIALLLFLSLAMASFYLIPLGFEAKYVLVGQFRDSPYSEYFMTLKKFWSSPWGWGSYVDVGDAVSLQIGKTFIIVSSFALLMNLFVKTKFRKLINFFVLCTVFFVFMELRVSDFIWKRVTLLHFFQFPWRLHVLLVLFLSFLSGSVFFILSKITMFNKKKELFLILFGLIVIIFSFAENYKYFKPKLFWNAPAVSETTTWNDEYLPRWVKIKPKDYTFEKVVILNGEGKIKNIEWGYLEKKFSLEMSKGGQIQISHVFYPGWAVYSNGVEEKISYDNPGGLMTISVNQGKSEIEFVFQRTWWRIVADCISIIGLTVYLFLSAKFIFFEKKHV